MSLKSIFSEENESLYKIQTQAEGPKGSLPLTPELLAGSPSGDIFGLTLNAGMGWEPSKLLGKQVMILSTQGGIQRK